MSVQDLLKTPQLFAVKKDGILQITGGLHEDKSALMVLWLSSHYGVIGCDGWNHYDCSCGCLDQAWADYADGATIVPVIIVELEGGGGGALSGWPFGRLRAGHHGVIYADPPWTFRGYASGGVPQRSGEQHYPTMTIEDMAALPVHRLAAPDCALFMWTTSSHTPQAFGLAERWGFRYVSKAFTWAKLNKKAIADKRRCDDPSAYFMGMGYGTRRNTEDCYLFRKGAPRRLDAGVRELIVSPIREHSRKPDEAYHLIERLFAGPYCELFSRTDRADWSSWGNEVGKFAP